MHSIKKIKGISTVEYNIMVVILLYMNKTQEFIISVVNYINSLHKLEIFWIKMSTSTDAMTIETLMSVTDNHTAVNSVQIRIHAGTTAIQKTFQLFNIFKKYYMCMLET